MAYHQRMVTTETVTTDPITTGGKIRVEVSTACDDLYTVQAALSEEEIRRLGVPGPVYTVKSVSPDCIKLFDVAEEMAERGLLHTEMVGMNLQSCAETLVQVELWMRAGERAGEPYPWETVGAALVPVLARALEREPTKEEVEEILKRIKLDIGQIRIKAPLDVKAPPGPGFPVFTPTPSDLAAKLEKLEAEIQKLEAELKETKEVIDRKEKLAKEKRDIEQADTKGKKPLKDALDEKAKKKSAEVDKKEEEAKEAKKKAKETKDKDEKKKLEESAKKLDEEAKKLKKEADDFGKDASKLEKEVDKLRKDAENLQKKIDGLKKQKEQLEKKGK